MCYLYAASPVHRWRQLMLVVMGVLIGLHSLPWRHEQLRRPELNCSAHLHTRLKRPHPFQFGLQARIGVHVHGLFTERACWPSSIGRIN
jgi:hypothetical protein